MPCDIIYSGKKYSLAEFVGLLSDGELVAKINDNTISGALADKYKEAFSNEFQASVNIINKVRDAAEKIAGAFLNRFGINVNIINSEQLGKMLATDENAKEFFFKILDEIDVFSSQNLDEAKSFITRVFQTVENKEDAKKAYRKLAVKYHPDKQGSEEIMKHLNDINEKYQKGLIKPQETPTSENKKYKDWAEKVYKKAEAETKAYEYARRQGSGVYEQYGQKQTERKPEGERYQNINRERYSSGQQQQQQQQQPKTKSEPKNKGFWSSIFDLFTKPSTPNPKSQPKSEVLTNERRDEIKSDLIKKREKLKQDNSKKLKEFEDINSKLYNTNKITSEQFYQRNKDARDNFYEKNKKIDDWYYDLVGKIDKAYYNKTPFTYKQYIGDKIGGIYNPVTFESYIVLDNLDETSFIHEAFSHPFIEAIKVRNPKLYDNLLAESKNEAQIVDYVNENYSQQPQEVKDAEYIARAIDLDAKGKLKNKKLIDYIKEFWLEANKIFKDIFGGKDAKIENIDAQTTISDIVDFVLMSNQKLDLKAATAPQEATKKDDTKQTISAAAKPIQPTTKAAAPQTETAGKAAVQQGTTTDSGRRAEGAAAVPVAAPQLGDTITITSKTDGKPIRYFYENGWKFLDSRGRTQNTTEKEAAAVTEKWAAQQKTGSIQEGMQKLADPIKIDEVVAPVMLQNKAVFDDYFKRAQAVLKTLFPNASIVLAKTNKEYTEINEKVTGRKSEYSSFGIWHPKENIIVLNGELIDKFIKNQDRPEVTAIHEVIHPIVWQASSYDPNVLNDLTEQIKELAKVGYEPAKIALQHASGIAYKEWQVPHETVTEFITMVIAGKADINKIPVSWQNKVLRLINQFLKWIGAKPIANAYDLRKLTEAVKKAFDSATDGIANVSDILDVVGRKNLQKPFLQGQGRVEIALQSYATNAQIEEWLRENLKTIPDLTVDEVIEAIAEDSRESINTTAKEAAVRKLVERIIDEQTQKPTAAAKPISRDKSDVRDKTMAARAIEGAKISEATKKRLQENLKSFVASQIEAKSIARAIINEHGRDIAINMADKNIFDGDINSAIYGEALDDILSEQNAAKTADEKQKIAEEWADVLLQYQDKAESGGRFNGYIGFFYKNNPAGLIIKVEKEFKRRRDDFLKGKEKNIKEAFEEFINTAEGRDVFEAAMAERGVKKREKVFSAKNEKKIIDFFDNLKIKTKDTTGSYLIPPQLYNAAIEIIKQAVISGVSIGRAIENAVDYINENNGGQAWKVKEFRKDFKEQFNSLNVKPELTEELKEKILKKWRRKLAGLTDEQRKNILQKAFTELIETGALDYEDFKNMYATAIGLPQMTNEMRAQLIDLSEKVRKPEILKEELQKNPTKKGLDEYTKALSEAEIASRKLNELIAKEKSAFDTFLTVMRLNTLGFISLVGNVAYNVTSMPVRAFVDLTKTSIDAVVAGAAIASDKVFGTNIFDKEKMYIPNPIKVQGGYWRGQWHGTKKALEQAVTGLSSRDYFQKEVKQNIQPLESMKRFFRIITRQEKASLNIALNAFIEAFPTMGMSAEMIARGLNIGDKGFRYAAEYAEAVRIADRKGLKGIEREVFLMAPDDISAEQIAARGEEVTFQQKNVITKMIDSMGQTATAFFDNLGGGSKVLPYIMKFLRYTSQPFLNTPLNVFFEYIMLVNPPATIARGVKGIVEGDYEAAKKDFARAVVGLAILNVTMQIVKAGLVEPESDEEESAKERMARTTYMPKGHLNVSGVKRLLAGDDASFKDEDITVSMKYFGFIGMLLLARAKQYQDNPEMRSKEVSFIDDMVSLLPYNVKLGLTEGVFGGTSSLLNAISMGGKYTDDWMISAAGVFTNAFQPQWIAALSRVDNNYIRDTKGMDVSEELQNKLKDRFFMGKGLPQKYNIWGEPLTRVPEGKNRFLWHYFNINKSTPIDNDKFGYVLYDLYKKTGDVDVFPPAVGRTVAGKELTAEQYSNLTMLIGQHRMQLVEPLVKNDKVAKMKPLDAKKQLSRAYLQGRYLGLREFAQIYPEFDPKEIKKQLKELEQETWTQ